MRSRRFRGGNFTGGTKDHKTFYVGGSHRQHNIRTYFWVVHDNLIKKKKTLPNCILLFIQGSYELARVVLENALENVVLHLNLASRILHLVRLSENGYVFT